MDRGTRPLHQQYNDKLILPIQHMLKGFGNFDPTTENKMAAHPDLPLFAVRNAYRWQSSVVREAIDNLICIAFYYLLQIEEYTTKTKRKKKTRTRQFRVKDVTFFKRGKDGRLHPIPNNATEQDIMSADAATLRILNQKNGHAGAFVHHSANKECPLACPVKALARRVAHIKRHTANGNAFLCTYYDEAGRGLVTNDQVSFTVKCAANCLKYEERGIPIDRVDTHSLRSGGVCALKLSGHDDVEIRNMGRWAPKSNTFLSRIKIFTNMEGNTEREDLRPSTIF